MTWAKKCCFRTNIEQVHTTSLMLFDNCKDTQLERWLKHIDDWVPVYFLGNHSFDYVCVIIKTIENFNLQLQSTTDGTLDNDQCMYYCCIWQLSMSYIRCFAYKYLIWERKYSVRCLYSIVINIIHCMDIHAFIVKAD